MKIILTVMEMYLLIPLFHYSVFYKLPLGYYWQNPGKEQNIAGVMFRVSTMVHKMLHSFVLPLYSNTLMYSLLYGHLKRSLEE